MDYEKEWKKLIEENDRLRKEYQKLIDEIKVLKKMSIRAIYGNGLRYKIAKMLMK